MTDLDRRLAWSRVRAAVRSYAKDPTNQSAEQVEEAWSAIRQLDRMSHWQAWKEARLNPRHPAGGPGARE